MLHLDCSSGVSGDMLVASLVDLGAEFEPIREALSGVAELSLREVTRAGVRAKKLDVRFSSESRKYLELMAEIDALEISPRARALSRQILHNLALAESRVHKTPLEGVHLHEARDSIVDAVAFSLALEDLGFFGSPIFASILSTGRIAPATGDIIRENSLPTRPLIEEEIATPTGVAILASSITEFIGVPPTHKGVGYGAGAMDLPHPNVLRAALI